MYNTSYEDYMRTVLGYMPNCMQDTYANNDYYISQNNNMMNNLNLNDLYPDIYRRIYPLVCNECGKNTMPVTVEILEQMTDNVLNQIEIDLKITTNVKTDTRKEDRAPQNNLLRDLIKILILRQILDGGSHSRPPFPGGRPPIPGHGPRPPFHGGRLPFQI